MSMRSADLQTINASLQRLQQRLIYAVIGVGLVIAAVLAPIPLGHWGLGGLGALALLRAWWRR